MNITLIDPRLIDAHPKNAVLYGEDDILADFVESIRRTGVQTNLVVKPGADGRYVCISGHRRCKGAIAANLETVPCHVKSYEHESDEVDDIIDLNRNREKTARMLAAEIDAKVETYTEAAKRRRLLALSSSVRKLTDGDSDDEGEQLANDDPSSVRKLTDDGKEPESGRTDELIAAGLGITRGRFIAIRTVFSEHFRAGKVCELIDLGIAEPDLTALMERWHQIAGECEAGTVSLTKAADQIGQTVEMARLRIKGQEKSAPSRGSKPAPISLPPLSFKPMKKTQTIDVRASMPVEAIGGSIDLAMIGEYPAVVVGSQVVLLDRKILTAIQRSGALASKY